MRFHNLGCYVCFIKYKSCLFAPEFYDAINFANIVTLGSGKIEIYIVKLIN